MRVIYIIDTLQTGGAEKSLLAIVKRFTIIQPLFWVLYEGEHSLSELYEEAKLQVKYWNFPPTTSRSFIAKKLSAEIGIEKPIVIHSTLFRSDMVSRQLSGDFVIINSIVNNSYHWRRYKDLSLKEILALLRVQFLDFISVKKVDYWIANSSYLAKVHQKYLGIENSKIKVIPRGRAIEKNTRTFESRSDDIVFLNISRLIHRKGLIDLVYAFRDLVARFPIAKLYLVGDGPLKDDLAKLIERLNLADNVFLLGGQLEVGRYLYSCDFFVFPSHYEGLPGALIEAMLAKKPIIASDIPEIKACVHSNMAMFHEVGNRKDLAKTLDRAITYQNWEEEVNRAYYHALNEYDIDNISRNYEEFYLKHSG
ncbi:glycosyl transferase family 1 [Echinicola pacifica]|uniref:Glycosyl transferase family 1 n=1 Tax=Echinicola pacifica TaxID=346377 RepID=A0A918PJQ2_9BACT|nr:glycosyltransferase [Echinicola pacifica]GGZ12838.1 glycosyl transferase family 1 [Echinicola pacifica]